MRRLPKPLRSQGSRSSSAQLNSSASRRSRVQEFLDRRSFAPAKEEEESQQQQNEIVSTGSPLNNSPHQLRNATDANDGGGFPVKLAPITEHKAGSVKYDPDSSGLTATEPSPRSQSVTSTVNTNGDTESFRGSSQSRRETIRTREGSIAEHVNEEDSASPAEMVSEVLPPTAAFSVVSTRSSVADHGQPGLPTLVAPISGTATPGSLNVSMRSTGSPMNVSNSEAFAEFKTEQLKLRSLQRDMETQGSDSKAIAARMRRLSTNPIGETTSPRRSPLQTTTSAGGSSVSFQDRIAKRTDSGSDTQSRGGRTFSVSGVSQQSSVGTSRLMPFIGNLALQSFQLTATDEPVIAPVEVTGAVLFVDLSGYSEVARVLESAGAVALFEAVNAYIEKIVEVIVSKFGGEVIKYAGDAVMAVWYRGKKTASRAVHCAVALQRDLGEHQVTAERPDLKFQIHIGIVHGKLTSHVLRAESATNMQKNYHFVSGQCLEVLEHCVSTAQPGETCVTQAVLDECCEGYMVEGVSGRDDIFHLRATKTDCCALASVSAKRTAFRKGSNGSLDSDVDDSFTQEMSDMEEESNSDSSIIYDYVGREEQTKDFVHPKLRERFRHGLKFSQMAELRLLAVLFIHKSDADVDAREWFVEVQQTLDEHRCPIVQVLDGDKGIHIVAAVNLFIADREPAVTAVRIAKMLEEREAGCTVGVACGMTFCGVVGSSVAARWDIVGNMCVRAARLMQHGLATKQPSVIGESVLEYSEDASLLQYSGSISLKGTPEPVKVFRLAPVDTRVLACITSATRSCPGVHVEAVAEIKTRAVNTPDPRVGLVLEGPPESGKMFVCVRAVYQTGVIPFVHTTPPTSRDLSVIETIATWFSHHIDDEVRELAVSALQAFEKGHVMKASRRGRALIDAVVSKGLKYALVIRQAQCLDGPSLSFLQHTLYTSRRNSVAGSTTSSNTEEFTAAGKWLVFACTVPQTGLPSGTLLAERMGKRTGARVSTLGMSRMNPAEGAALVSFRLGWRCEPQLSDTLLRLGGQLPGCVDKVITALEHRKIGRVTATGEFTATAEEQRKLSGLRWLDISPAVCTKASQVVDALGVTAKTILKTLRALSNPFDAVPVAFLLRVIQHIVPSCVPARLAIDTEALLTSNVLEDVSGPRSPSTPEVSLEDKRVEFATPAMADVVKSISLSSQMKSVTSVARELLREDPSWRDSLTSRLVIAHYEALSGHKGVATEMISDVWHRLSHQADPGDSALRKAIVRDCYELRLKVPELASHREEEVSIDQASMPEVVLKLNKFRPPFSMGGLTHAWRQTAVTLRELAVCASRDTEFPEESIEETRKLVRFFCKMIRIVDRHIGYECPLADEEATVLALLVNAPFEQVCKNAESFFKYFETVLLPRISASHTYMEKTMAHPEMPDDKPAFWQGPQRVGMERALDAVIRSWRTCPITATRDGMMVMATQGWIPKNPDQTLEFQRDSYFKLLTYPMDCFPSLLHTNLCLFVE